MYLYYQFTVNCEKKAGSESKLNTNQCMFKCVYINKSLNFSAETITPRNFGHREKTTWSLTCTKSVCFLAYLNTFHIPWDLLQSHSWFGSCWIVDSCAKNVCILTCSWSPGGARQLALVYYNKYIKKYMSLTLKSKVVYNHFISPYIGLASVAYLY